MTKNNVFVQIDILHWMWHEFAIKSFKLIVHNDKMYVNVTTLKWLEYWYLHICSFGCKVIIVWLCNELKLIGQFKQNKHRNKMKKSNYTAQNDEQNKSAAFKCGKKKNFKYLNNIYLDKRERKKKRCIWVVPCQKMS